MYLNRITPMVLGALSDVLVQNIGKSYDLTRKYVFSLYLANGFAKTIGQQPIRSLRISWFAAVVFAGTLHK